MKDNSPMARARAENSFRDVQGKTASKAVPKPQYEVEGDALRDKIARLKALREAQETAQSKPSKR